ncbi:phosphogluconate dehydratase [Aeromonas hydrophila]|uniref:Phosphogluconate dehydratase n=1 Tax=Aeromonas hydrophila subsp. hydrophila (strain ATCC 7966 / DSM 30187 / BCRC 13018 / CCUG 14551 / JCM 1027 / KCTC 2358 / NCIMB 9240 / NCTC 8049) TaxID=380703 RepID=A0KF00_AERHH|nr:phosphogluconate dehydratase [Aeromonas hydrophila]ABK38540.1 phosphogluconate dehydratase [Aeromonas hydrophila subsp. hydrophila ATCC 7966]MBS4673753.1 phosphogluconate dehydratase [Aeromonas hydrophila]NLR35120.1 phosphogluconate dehydratase [Aeromonas hydrophila]OOD35867.1 phosphogluconate dehydratase [Aeromonas hydrophila]SUU13862.1 phosphogluconate dehydratase [Aeromonas hydrophila]
MIHQVISSVTARIRERSAARRQAFLARIQRQADQGKTRAALACGNLAHAVAASSCDEKGRILDMTRANVGIVTAYNDMLSAHQPYQGYPDIIKAALAELGHSAQVAGGVPAMCDGVTQGQPGMDMSLFSRDLIAQATALSLSHNTFDATLLLGICDKIAPGQIMGALSHAHLPTAFVPAGPMASGISNDEKVKVRQQYAAGEVGRDALLQMECGAYHAAGTCTFYGTANTNQLVFEAMGLMLPGSAFVHPHSELRRALTEEAARRISAMIPGSPAYRPLSAVIDERSLVNGLVALLASGGSTNHSIHMVALARAAGLHLTWDDISDLSDVVPLLVRMYPNGPADVNAFEQAGGVPGLMRRLAEEGLIHLDATPVFGEMQDYLSRPALVDGQLVWQPVGESGDASVLSPSGSVFQATGGTKLLAGNLGRAVVKVSAVAPEYRVIEAPARVFSSQHAVEAAYKAGDLNQDAVIVVRHNGPAANGMPELHKLMPVLGNLQKAGYKVALVTDGRLSGASGKIPAAIHVTPEALHGGAIGLLADGDLLRVDAVNGSLDCLTDLSGRTQAEIDLTLEQEGWGRELFSVMRRAVSSAECGATIFD